MKVPVPDVILPADELGRVHFIGIGGAGLSGIARIMLARGLPVSGSGVSSSSWQLATSSGAVVARPNSPPALRTSRRLMPALPPSETRRLDVEAVLGAEGHDQAHSGPRRNNGDRIVDGGSVDP